MLKVNESCLYSANVQMIKYSRILHEQLEQIQTVIAAIEENQSLDEELFQLKQIEPALEHEYYKSKKLVQILQGVCAKYNECERTVALAGREMKPKRKAVFGIIHFNIPKDLNIKWELRGD